KRFTVHPSQQNAATGEADRRTSKSPLKIHPLRFRSKEKLTAGVHSRREREVRRQRQEQQAAKRQGRSGGRNN
ncbi:MAG TPA: hypothetical protein PK670_16655, partial [Acidovorax defluvii]|nr:hypothetical protein [Acidovorax defluvii]